MTVVRVATFNVCGLPSPLPPLVQRAAEFCRRLDASDLDVVNLQEVWSPRAFSKVRAGLPSFPHVGWRRGPAGQPSGGLVTFSRVALSAVAYRSFRGTVPAAGGARFRVRLAVNSALQGVLTAELTGLGIVVANTHLTANKDGTWSAANRHHGFQRDQLSRLHARVGRVADGRPAVLTGDFNVASDSPLYPAVVDNGRWSDPFAAADPATYQADFLPAGSTGKRIDYLLVAGGATADDPRVLFTEPVPLAGGRSAHLSDHVALAANVSMLAPAG